MFSADAIAAARAQLPFCVGWSHAVFLPALAFAAVTAVAAGNRRCLRRAMTAEHWTEQARWSAAAGRYGSAGLFIAGVTVVVLGFMQAGSLTAPWLPAPVLGGLIVLGAVVAYLCALYRQAHRLRGERLTPRYFLSGIAAWVLLMVPHFVAALVLALGLPAEFDAGGIVVAVVGILLMGFAATGCTLYAARWLGIVRPPGARLAVAVERASAATGVTPRAVHEARWPIANAFALPWLRHVVVTDLAVAELDGEALAAVIGHELAHVTESRAVCLMRALAVMLLVPVAAWRPMVHVGGLPLYLSMFLAVVVTWILLKRLWHRMEVRADAAATEGETESGAYARALLAIYETNLVPAVMGGRRNVHPNLYDRVKAAGFEPDFPRPDPPPRGPNHFAGGLACGIALILLIVVPFGGHYLRSLGAPDTIVSIALLGGGAREAEWLAFHYQECADDERSLIFYRAAAAMTPESPRIPAILAMALAGQGRREEASRALDEAELRYRRIHAEPWQTSLLEDARQAVEAAGERQPGDEPELKPSLEETKR